MNKITDLIVGVWLDGNVDNNQTETVQEAQAQLLDLILSVKPEKLSESESSYTNPAQSVPYAVGSNQALEAWEHNLRELFGRNK